MPINLLNGFTIGGNNLDKDQTILLSFIELEVRKVLENSNFTIFQRFAATAKQQSELDGVGVAVYRFADRQVWGTDYNEITGSKRQIGSAKSLKISIDQLLTIDFVLPENDLKRLKGASPAIRDQIIAEWNATIMINKLYNLELIFLQGIKYYHIWRYQFDKESILVLDLSKNAIKNENDAIEAFYTIGEKMLKKTTTITKNEVGTNKSDWGGFFSPQAWLNLSRVYTKFVNNTENVNVNTLATGDLYKDAILGTSIAQHYFLGQTLTAGTETAMNKDVSYDLTAIEGFFIHNENEAMPISFEKMMMVVDNYTTNLRMVGRVMFGIPAFTRPNLGFVIMDHEPTEFEIAEANSMIWKEPEGFGVYENNMTSAFQLTTRDEMLMNMFDKDKNLKVWVDFNKDKPYQVNQIKQQVGVGNGNELGLYATDQSFDLSKPIPKADWDKANIAHPANGAMQIEPDKIYFAYAGKPSPDGTTYTVTQPPTKVHTVAQ